MAELPLTKTVAAIYATKENSGHRPHLGASQIGGNCERKMWYIFRHCKSPQFDGRMIRLFETGQMEERRIIQELRESGVQIWAIDPKTKKQFEFKEFGGHFAGSLDGVARNVPEAPATAHVLEIKSHNDRSFKDLVKKGVTLSKPEHYCQIQVYMHEMKLIRALYVAVNKNTDEIYAERIKYNKEFALLLLEKAKAVICADAPGERIADKEGTFACKFCDFKDLCWKHELPEINCRTCCHSTPNLENGLWDCDVGEDTKQGCHKHIFIPSLLPWDPVDADETEGWIKYSNDLINGPGPGHTKSANIKIVEPAASEG